MPRRNGSSPSCQPYLSQHTRNGQVVLTHLGLCAVVSDFVQPLSLQLMNLPRAHMIWDAPHINFPFFSRKDSLQLFSQSLHIVVAEGNDLLNGRHEVVRPGISLRGGIPVRMGSVLGEIWGLRGEASAIRPCPQKRCLTRGGGNVGNVGNECISVTWKNHPS